MSIRWSFNACKYQTKASEKVQFVSTRNKTENSTNTYITNKNKKKYTNLHKKKQKNLHSQDLDTLNTTIYILTL